MKLLHLFSAINAIFHLNKARRKECPLSAQCAKTLGAGTAATFIKSASAKAGVSAINTVQGGTEEETAIYAKS